MYNPVVRAGRPGRLVRMPGGFYAVLVLARAPTRWEKPRGLKGRGGLEAIRKTGLRQNRRNADLRDTRAERSRGHRRSNSGLSLVLRPPAGAAYRARRLDSCTREHQRPRNTPAPVATLVLSSEFPYVPDAWAAWPGTSSTRVEDAFRAYLINITRQQPWRPRISSRGTLVVVARDGKNECPHRAAQASGWGFRAGVLR